MNKYEFSDNSKLPETIQVKLKRFKEICKKIQESTEDTGFKDGIMTTSYEHNIEKINLKKWQGDAETMQTVLINGEIVARFYDCWGTGYFELLNDDSVDLIEQEFNSNNI